VAFVSGESGNVTTDPSIDEGAYHLKRRVDLIIRCSAK
jgi:hypothetical protein